MAPDGARASVVTAAPRASFARDAVVSVATQVVTQLLVFGTAFVMPRIVPPHVKGVADPVMNLTLMLIVFDNLGLTAALVYHPMRRERSLDQIASTVLTAGLLIGSVTAGIAALFLPGYFASKSPSLVDPWHVALVLATAPLQLVTSYLNVTQLIAGRALGYNFIQFLPPFLFVAAFFSIYAAVGPARFEAQPALFLSAMVWARVIQWVVSSLTATTMLRKVATFRPNLDWEFLRASVKFGLRPYLRDVFLWLTSYFVGYYLVQASFDPRDVGFYWLAMSAPNAVWQIPEALQLVFGNRLASITTQADRDKFTPLYCRNVIFVCFLVAVIVALVSEVVLRYWAPRYVEAVPTIRILLLGSVPFTLFRVLQADFLSRGEINRVPFYSFLSFALIAGLTVLCVRGFGLRTIETVAACNAAAVSFVGLLTAFHYSRLSGNSLSSVLFFRASDVELWREGGRRLWGAVARVSGR